MKKRIGILAGLLLFGTGTIFGAEGRKEIFKPVVLSGADANGKFFLSRDITATGGLAAIKIVGTGVENVEIDLNGFCVAGDPASTEPVIFVTGSGLKTFILRNGGIVGKNPAMENVKVFGVDNNPSDKAVIEGLTISGGGSGIVLDRVTTFAIRGNVVVESGLNNFGIGIQITDTGSNPDDLTGIIENNVVSDAHLTAIDVGTFAVPSRSVVIRNNQIAEREQNGDGIFVRYSVGVIISENTIVEAYQGIRMEDMFGCAIRHNVIADSLDSGIDMTNSDDCHILDNSVSFNGINFGAGHGLRLGDSSERNHIDRNLFNLNGAFGILFDATSTENNYGRNTLRGNGGGTCTPPGAVPCAAPSVCDLAPTGSNLSFGDNLTSAGGC